MMALLMESVPSFEKIWMEYLGHLARYRMDIETDHHDRMVWAGVAQHWDNEVARAGDSVLFDFVE